MSNPDLVDIVHDWLKEKYPQFKYEVLRGNCSDGKVVIVRFKEGYSERDDHILTLSIKGRVWHNSTAVDSSPEISAILNPADPNFFKTLNWMINRAKTKREGYATRI
jgi:hypothetical protein